MTNLDTILANVDENLEVCLERLDEFLRIPTISTDPAYKADCIRGANWLVDQLDGLGFDVCLHRTPGHPMVVAHHMVETSAKAADKNVPHILFYGHYDVQPPDPLNEWHTPPFEPVRKIGKDGAERIYARGAADDKGQLLTFIEAVRAMFNATFDKSLNMTLLFEGEEESGSPSLEGFLDENAAQLSHDIALVCDTNMWDEYTPAITTRLRGMVHDEITITGPSIDLHSGLYGGPAINPIRVLSKILADMHDETGRVTLDGFYDGVSDLPEKTARQWRDLDLTPEKFLGDIGLHIPAGETGYSVLEQVWSRPTLDVNGIYGGYTGEGTKTVIPSKASAKISCRLVGKQDPEKIKSALRKFVTERLPGDCSVEFLNEGGASPALEISEDLPELQKVVDALRDEFGKDPVLMGCGGSIPVVGEFKTRLGMDSILVGFGLPDDAIHSPNEKYDINSFHKGIKSWVRILDALAV